MNDELGRKPSGKLGASCSGKKFIQIEEAEEVCALRVQRGWSSCK